MTTEYVLATRQEQKPEAEQKAAPKDSPEQKAEAAPEPKAEAEQKPREQRGDGSAEQQEAPSTKLARDAAEPDVLLDVPAVKVEELSLDVEELRAHVSLFARVGNLVALDVGAKAVLGKLKLASKGIHAQALLKVRLQKVYAILERTLSTIDRHPEILASLSKPVGEAVGAIGGTVDQTLPKIAQSIEKTGSQVGQAVGSTTRRAADAATPHADDPSRAQRALQRIEQATRKCAARARRAVWTARQAIRARRGAKAVRDVTRVVPSLDPLRGK